MDQSREKMDDDILKLLETLKPESRGFFLSLPRADKEIVVIKAREDGTLLSTGGNDGQQEKSVQTEAESQGNPAHGKLPDDGG